MALFRLHWAVDKHVGMCFPQEPVSSDPTSDGLDTLQIKLASLLCILWIEVPAPPTPTPSAHRSQERQTASLSRADAGHAVPALEATCWGEAGEL